MVIKSVGPRNLAQQKLQCGQRRQIDFRSTPTTDRSARQMVKHPQRQLKRKAWHITNLPASCNRNTHPLDYTLNTHIAPGPWVIIVKNPALARIVGVR